MATTGQHQLSTFSSPNNTPATGDALDANVVRGNDNTIATKHNAHDNDQTIHFLSGTFAARPAFGVAGRKYITTDSPRRIFYDTGTGWAEVDYAPASGTLPDQYFYLFATRI
jgi:hypothetical protein